MVQSCLKHFKTSKKPFFGKKPKKQTLLHIRRQRFNSIKSPSLSLYCFLLSSYCEAKLRVTGVPLRCRIGKTKSVAQIASDQWKVANSTPHRLTAQRFGLRRFGVQSSELNSGYQHAHLWRSTFRAFQILNFLPNFFWFQVDFRFVLFKLGRIDSKNLLILKTISDN